MTDRNTRKAWFAKPSRIAMVIIVGMLLSQPFLEMNAAVTAAATLQPGDWDTKKYEGSYKASATFDSVVKTLDGGYVAVGSYSISLYNRDALIVKFDSAGNVVWEKTYGGTLQESFNSLASTSDGGFIAVGYSNSSDIDPNEVKGGFDATLVKYDSAGHFIADQRFGGSRYDVFISIRLLKQGGFVAVGSTSSNDLDLDGLAKGNDDGLIVRYDDALNVIDKQVYGGSGYDRLKSVSADSDGGFVVAGYSIPVEGAIVSSEQYLNSHAVVVKYDKAGTLVWQKINESGSTNQFASVAISANGQIVVVGNLYRPDIRRNIDIFSRYDSLGNLLDTQYILENSIQFTSIQPLSDGGFVIVGYNTDDAIVLRYDSTGTFMWKKSLGNPTVFNEILSLGAGKFLIVGYDERSAIHAVLSESYIQGTSPISLPSEVRVMWNQTSIETGYSVSRSADGYEVIFDSSAFMKILDQVPSGPNPLLRVTLLDTSPNLTVKLDVALFRALQDKRTVIEISTQHASTYIATDRMNLEASLTTHQNSTSSQNLKVHLQVQGSTEAVSKKFSEQVQIKNAKVVVKPMTFSIVLFDQTKSQSFPITEKFPYTFISRWIPTTSNDTESYTAMRIENDGTLRHVPTKRIQFQGKSYLLLQSIEANGNYGVIAKQLTYEDISSHWAKSYIEVAAKRTLFDRYTGTRFEANREVTRAEFVSMLIEALGLPFQESDKRYSDLLYSESKNNYIQTASAYRFLREDQADRIRTQDTITRAEAMVIVARAIEITPYMSHFLGDDGEIDLYQDHKQIPTWATAESQVMRKAKIFLGDSRNMLRPHDALTRGETAAVLERMLEHLTWIDTNQ